MVYFSDELFRFQSYLSGEDFRLGALDITEASPVLRIEPIWDTYRGKGIVIAAGLPVDRLHPDIAPNYDSSTLSTYDPLDDLADNPEAAFLATFWAGLAAGDDNGTGIVGVAPDASITSFLQDNASYADITIVPAATDRQAAAPDLSFQTEARGGLGGILVATAPPGSTSYGILDNDFPFGDVNTDYALTNDRHLATVVGVTSVGAPSVVQTNGDMTLLAAPIFTDTVASAVFGDETPTLGPDPRGAFGVNADGDTLGLWQLLAETEIGTEIDEAAYAVEFTGLGASAVTAGAVALILEANPDLGWRDVQEILAYSAQPLPQREGPLGPTGFPVEINGAETWNGGGLHYSPEFGFGALEIYGAVRLAETWTRVSTSRNEARVAADRQTELPIGEVLVEDEFADNPFVFTFTAPENIRVEHVALSVDFTARETLLGSNADDFNIRIVSPNGTASDVAAFAGVFDEIDVEGFDTTLTSRNFWGEKTQDGSGEWRVEFTAGADLLTSFNTVDLQFYGAAKAEDDIYVFTDYFDDVSESDYDREIDDDAGTNVVNAAALTSAVNLTAVPGGSATALGATLYTLTASSEIALLIAGDGDDRLRASDAGTELWGMRGADTLLGGNGTDTLRGDTGRDVVDGGAAGDRGFGGAGADKILGRLGNDTLFGGDGADTLKGGNGNDNVTGGNGQDRAVLGAGADDFSGGAGADTVYGGGGKDQLNGGGGADDLFGGNGADQIEGGGGADDLSGGAGNDMLRGGSGSDRFLFEPGFAADVIFDFDPRDNGEKIDLSELSAITGLADLRANHMGQSGDDTIIRVGGNTITLIGTNANDLGPTDFLF